MFLEGCVTPPHTTSHSTTNHHRPHQSDVYNPAFATMLQPSTLHGDHHALDALAGLLNRAEVSGKR